MSLALYRKYRPRSFAELVGQDYLVEIFRNAARQNKLAQAYIFYGPRGTGKTTTARLVAKLANCLASDYLAKDGEPCNKCHVCQEIDSGRAIDIIEIDAASNRGIDEIRSLKEGIRLSPASYRRKVFIIDEAHMLTKEAFNALLKTLEEPPEHAVLILATTEYEKIPATICSRAQRFHFRKSLISDITRKLKAIIVQEKIKINDDALELIAASADGSFRDAESLLDQIASSNYGLTKPIDLEAVENVIGRVGSRRIIEFCDLVAAADLKGALVYLHDLNRSGANLVDLNKELINYLRRVLALNCDQSIAEIFANELTRNEMDKIKMHSQKINKEKLISLIKSLIRAYSEMRYSPFPHVPLELAIIESMNYNTRI